MMNQLDTPTLSFNFAASIAPAGQVLQFSGSTSVTDNSVINFPVNGLTLSFWIKTTSTANEVLFSYDAMAPDNSQRLLVNNATSLQVSFGDSSTGPTGIAVNDGGWHHIAINVAPTGLLNYGIEIFRDGVSAYMAAGAITHPLNKTLQTQGALVLGHGVDAEAGFNGLMSEFRLWNAPLTPDQVMTTMLVRETAQTPGIVIVWALDSIATSGTIVNGTFVDNDLRFRTYTMLASWSQVAGATYNLQVTQVNGSWTYIQNNISTTSQAVTGYFLNKSYVAKVQAVVGGVPGQWSNPMTIITMNLQQPQIALSQSTPTSLQASWPQIDQAQSFNFTQQPAGGNPQVTNVAGTSFDITGIATGATACDFTVDALSMGAASPASDSTTPNALTLTLTYYNTGGTNYIKADWNSGGSSPTYYYLEIYRNATTGTPIFTAFYKDQTTANVSGFTFDPGITYYGKVRPIVIGKAGAFSPWAQVVPFTVLAPIVGDVTSDATALTISLAWTFDATPYTNTVYTVQLLNAQQDQIPLLTGTTDRKNYTFSNPAGQNIIQTNTYYYVRVQAMADHVDSPFSQTKGIGVATISPATNLQLTANNDGLITVGWNSSESNATFKAAISINGTEKATHDNLTTTSTGFTATETGVTVGSTYTVLVTIWTIKSGQTSIPATLTQSLKIESTPPPRPDSPSKGDPVNLATGAYQYSNMDIGVPCAEPLLFITYYGTAIPLPSENSLYSNMPLGNRWNHRYNTRIAFTAGGAKVAVIWGDGHTDTYLVPSSVTGNYPAESAPRGNLLVLTSTNQFVLTTKLQETYTFTYDGLLRTIVSAIGNTITLAYNGSQLTRISLDSTHYLDLTYYNNGFLEKVTDPLNRFITYAYQGDNLLSITGVMGAPRSFTYDANSLVLTITDENNHMFIKNEYDAQRRVIRQWDARALASGQDYYSSFGYQQVTENGLVKIICNFTDRAGNTSLYKSYQDTANLEYSIVNLDASTIRRVDQTRDGFGNLLTERVYEGPSASWIAGKGNNTVYTYDGNDNLLTQTNPLGQVSTNTYNTVNMPLTVTDFNANTTKYEYAGNLLQKITDPLGRTTSFTFLPGSTKGLIETLTDVNGNTTSFTYDNGYLQQAADPLGTRTVYTNDAIGRVLTENVFDKSTALLRTTTNEYYPNNVVKKIALQYAGQTLADAFIWQYGTDHLGHITSTTDPEGNTISQTYNPNDFLDTVTYPVFNGMQRTTQYAYNRIDQLTKITYAPTVFDQYQYDQLSRLTQYTDANLNSYTYAYLPLFNPDNTYNLKQQTTYPILDPANPVVYRDSFVIDPIGRIIAQTDRSQATATIAYQLQQASGGLSYNQLFTLTLPPAKPGDPQYTVKEMFDAVQRRISVTDQLNKTSAITYTTTPDPVTNTNQVVVTVTSPLGNQQISVLDAAQRLAEYRKGKNNVWLQSKYAYDGLGRVLNTAEITAQGPVNTQFSYNFDSTTKLMKVAVGRPGDNATPGIFQYNGSGQLISETDPVNNSTRRAYTPWGGLLSYTNGRNQVLTYGFDLAGRFDKITLPGSDGTISHLLDGVGNRTQTLVNDVANITRHFDTWNRLKDRINASQQTVQYGYNGVDQVNLLTYSDNKAVNYNYDALYRLTGVTDWNQNNTTYQYNPTGTISKVQYPNGSTADLAFDDNGSLTGLEHTSGDIIIARLGFTLDELGNPTTNLAILPLPPQFTPTSHTLTYNSANQLATYDGAQLTYDGDGNQNELIQPAGPTPVTYDVFNRVKTLGQDTYSYDPDSMRIQTVLSGVTNNYLYDCREYRSPMLERADPIRNTVDRVSEFLQGGGIAYSPVMGDDDQVLPFEDSLDRLLEVMDAQGVLQQKYVYGMGLISREDADGSFSIYHCDQLGNTLATTDSNGNLSGKLLYDPYGGILNRYGNTTTPFHFSGGFGVMDDGNGLMYMRARSYSGLTARFLQKDYLFGNSFQPQTLNRYSYVTGNPIVFIDPLGLRGKEAAIGFGIGAAIGLGLGAIIGGIAGYLSGGTATAALAGAIVGGLGGALTGGVGGAIGGAVGGGVVGGSAGGSAGGVVGGFARTVVTRLLQWWRAWNPYRPLPQAIHLKTL